MSYPKYVSIDIETTGLNPNTCQIIEIGMVVETDWKTPVEDLPCWSTLDDPGCIRGEPFALQMNAEILWELAIGNGHRIATTGLATLDMELFLAEHFPREGCRLSFTAAGKNYAGFDRAFLQRLPGWFKRFKVHHRSLDPGSMYFDPRIDDEVPGTAECLRRAGLDPDVKHRTLEDARNVVRLIRHKDTMLEIDS